MQKFPIDLDENTELFKNFAKTQTEFTDYNFEGSGISQVNKILGYNTQQFAFYMNMILNDLFIDDVKTENNIYKIARLLNYIPRRKSAAYAIINIENTSAETILIPKFTKFVQDNVNLVTLEEYILTAAETKDIRVYEGEIIIEAFEATGLGFEEFIIEHSSNIDNDYLKVYVDRFQSGDTYISIEFKNANKSDFDIDRNNYYFKYLEKVSIKFDNGSVFEIPNIGDYVRVEYLINNGDLYNNISGDIIYDDINIDLGAAINVVAVTQILNYGSNEETIEGIKMRAPLYYTTQGRAVTESDYNYMMLSYSKYDTFADINIWSGSDEFIDVTGNLSLTSNLRDLGHAEITVLNNDYSYVNTSQKDDIRAFFNNRKAMTCFSRFVDPVILKIEPDIDIKLAVKTQTDISEIRSTINTYLKTLEGFKKTYQRSNIVAFIDNVSEIDYIVFDLSYILSINYTGVGFFRSFNEIAPGSIITTFNGKPFIDDAGILRYDGNQIGTVDYTGGIIDFTVDESELYGILDIPINFVNENQLVFQREVFLFFEDIILDILI